MLIAALTAASQPMMVKSFASLMDEEGTIQVESWQQAGGAVKRPIQAEQKIAFMKVPQVFICVHLDRSPLHHEWWNEICPSIQISSGGIK